MRQVGTVVFLLGVATHLPACAVGGFARELRGQSGFVSWEILDIRQDLVEHGSRMSWTFSIVVKNTGNTGIGFEHVEIGSQPGGAVDSFWGGIGTQPLTQRLEPGAETRMVRTHSSGCPQCAPADLHRAFADGVIVHYTLVGRDDAGGRVQVPITIRLNSSVGQRP